MPRRPAALRLARFGDNMRNVAVTEGDKVEAEIRFGMSVNTWGVNDLVAVVDAVADKAVDALIEEYGDLYELAADVRPGGDQHDARALPGPDRGGAAVSSSSTAASARSPRTSRTSAACASCPASPSSG